MDISEKHIRKIVREMLMEAEGFTSSAPESIKLSNPSYDPVFDVHRGKDTLGVAKANQPGVAEVTARMRKLAPKMKIMLIPIASGKRVITSRNATTNETLLMSMYLTWYALSRGVWGTSPWTESLYPGTTWPAEALEQFQIDQGLLADGKLGKQTATFMLSAGSRRVAVPGMTTAQSDVKANIDSQYAELFGSKPNDPAYTTPAARKNVYTAKQQSMLGKPAAAVKPEVVDITNTPASISMSIDDLREEVLDIFDEEVESNEDMMQFSRSDIASFRRSIEMFMDVDAEKIAMNIESMPMGIRNAVSRSLSSRRLPTEIINIPTLMSKLVYLVNLHAGAA